MTYAANANSRYLDGRVQTASQPELQLILLDGALRFARQAEQLWNEPEQRAECDHLLTRTNDIVEALIQGLVITESEISRRLADEYAFAFRQIALAQLNHDSAPLAAAIHLLQFERETWQLACEQLRAAAPAATPIAPLAGLHYEPAGLSLQG
jgi:flagellar secretion chaperone FliS